MNALELFKNLQVALQLLEMAGVSYHEFMQERENRKAEGKELTIQDLERLAAEAQAAVDRL